MFETYLHHLKAVELFKAMSQKEIITLLSHLSASLHTYEKDDYICMQQDNFLKVGILLDGKLECTRTYMAHSVTIRHTLKIHESFGEDIIGARCLSIPYSIQTLEPSILLLIDGADLFFMDHKSSPYMSKFLLNMMQVIAKRSIDSNEQIDYTKIPSLKRRVAVFLVNQYEHNGQLTFTISMSRYEMANYLSVTRPALSKVLAELKKDNVIDYYKDSFKIQDLQQLMLQ